MCEPIFSVPHLSLTLKEKWFMLYILNTFIFEHKDQIVKMTRKKSDQKIRLILISIDSL